MLTNKAAKLCLIAIFIAAVVLHHYVVPNFDVCSLLDFSKRMLHGADYGSGFNEVNPPLILFLYALPAWLSEHIAVKDYVLANYEGYIFVVVSMMLTNNILNLFFSKQESTHKWIFVMVLLVVFMIVPAGSFLQRENLMLVLGMPYMMLVALRMKGGSVTPFASTVAGILAGVAFAIKPHYAILPVVLEIVARLYSKRRMRIIRPETCAISAVYVLYALSVFIFFPGYIKLLFTIVIPYYGYFEKSSWSTLMFPFVYMFAGIVCALMLQGAKRLYKEISIVVLTAACFFVLTYFAQGQYWYYHCLPLLGCSIILLLLFMFGQFKGQSGLSCFYGFRSVLGLLLAICFVFMAVFVVANISIENLYSSKSNSMILKFVNYIERHKIKRVYFFSMNVPEVFAVSMSNADYVGSFTAHFLVSFIVKEHYYKHKTKPANFDKKLSFAKKYYVSTVVNTFITKKPDAVFVFNASKSEPATKPYGFNFLNFFERYPRFNAIWKNYHYVGRFAYADVYRLNGK